jgi:WD40 repeat protein
MGMNLLRAPLPGLEIQPPTIHRRRQRLWLVAGLLLSALCHARAQSATNALLWLRGGHGSAVNAVCWSADGSLVASASDDATVKLWTTNGMLVRTLTTQPYQATALAFSPDSAKLAVGAYAGGYYSASNGLGRVLVWQATDGWSGSNVSLARTLTNKFGKVASVAFSADGTRLASGVSGGSNYVHQAGNGALLAARSVYTTNRWGVSYEINAGALSVAFSAGGLLASGCEDSTIRVWNSSYTQVWTTNTAQASNVTAVAFSPNGATLASGSLDQTIKLWSTNGWSCLRTLTGHTAGVTAVSFSPDGNTLASGGCDGSVKLWELTGGTCVATIAAHADAVTSVAFSPDGTRLASGGKDNCVKIWSTAGGTLLQNLGDHADAIKAVAVSPDGTLCATASNDRTIQVHRLADGLLLRTLPGHTGCVSAIAFAPDSAVLASGGGPLDPTIKLCRLNDGMVLRTIPATTNGVMALAFSPDGLTLASGGGYDEGTICLWGAADGSLLRTLDGQSNGVTALAFSPNGNLLVSGGRRANDTRTDSTIKVWAVTNGSLVRAFASYSNNTESVAFAPDGNTVASGSSTSGVLNSSGTKLLTLWTISDGSSRTFGTDTNPVFFVAFSRDGSTLASASKDAIKFWNVAAGTLSQTLTQETFRVSCLAYAPNGNLFAFGREDATLALAGNAAVTISSPAGPALPVGTNSVVYSGQTFTASGGNGAYTFTVSVGSLPSGLNLSLDGLLSGTPAEPGDFNLTVQAKDGNKCTGSAAYILHIAFGQNGVSSVKGIAYEANAVILTNAGIPGYTYSVERTTNLVPGATWTPMWTTNLLTSPPVEVWLYFDSSPESPSGFYRLRSP